MKFSDINHEAASDSIERREVDMSEFWGEDAVVYARATTPADHRRVSVKYKGYTANPTLEGMCFMVCIVAETEGGEPFFEIKDRLTLIKTPLPILQKLFGLIGGEIDEDDVEKN